MSTLFLLFTFNIVTGNLQGQTVIKNEGEAVFKWEYPNPPADLSHFEIYRSVQSGVYNNANPWSIVSKDSLQYTAKDMADGGFFYVASAVDSAGNKSDFSNEVHLIIDTLKPNNVVNLRIIIITN